MKWIAPGVLIVGAVIGVIRLSAELDGVIGVISAEDDGVGVLRVDGVDVLKVDGWSPPSDDNDKLNKDEINLAAHGGILAGADEVLPVEVDVVGLDLVPEPPARGTWVLKR